MKASVGCYTDNISSRNMTLSIPLKIFALKRFHFDPPKKWKFKTRVWFS